LAAIIITIIVIVGWMPMALALRQSAFATLKLIDTAGH
jgi:hypothetical protein